MAEEAWKVKYVQKLRAFKRKSETLNLGPLRLPSEHHSEQRVTSLKDGGYIEMGSTGLMLNVITPLQKFSKGGTTISDVVRQRFQDLFQREISENTLTQVENAYTGKKEVIDLNGWSSTIGPLRISPPLQDRIKLQQVTILAELFTDDQCNFTTSALSDVVTNSKVCIHGRMRE